MNQFIKNIISSLIKKFKLPDGVKIYDGTAHCHTCKDKVRRKHYRVNDGDQYYCREHAIEEKNRLDNQHNKKPKIQEKQKEFGTKGLDDLKIFKRTIKKVASKTKDKCNYCKAKIKGLLDSYECQHCGKSHCTKHRLPEEHGCKNPKKPRGMTGSTIVYRQ